MKKITILFALFVFACATTFAQDEAPKEGWDVGLGVGLDLTQLLQINPKVGAGQDNIGLGGALTVFGNWKKDKHAWDNSASWRVGVQKLGGGQFLFNPDIKQPWQKAIDELRFDTKYGYAITENKKWYAATQLSFLSQIFQTYAGSYLKDITDTNIDPISKFFSPAQITYSIGIDYKPNENFSLYYSPIAIKMIVVADDAIADDQAIDGDGMGLGTSVHGNPWRTASDFDNTLFNFGSLLNAKYTRKFWEDGDGNARIVFATGLALYFDYLQGAKKDDNPNYKTHIDTDWSTETAFNVYKGLQIVLTTNLFYDWDVAVQETDRDAPGGLSGALVRKPSFTQQLLVKYAISF